MFTTVSECISKKISILVYGESGSGKTTLIKTLPPSTLVINAENGLRSLTDSSFDVYDVTRDSSGNELDRVRRYEKTQYILNELRSSSDLKKKYNWIVLDSLTEISQNLVEAMKAKYPDPKDTFKIWGDYNSHMTDMIKNIRDMNHYNVLFIALSTVDKDDSGLRFTGIDVQGKISQRIPALFDEVLFLKKVLNEKGDEERVLLTSSYKNITAKDRSGKLAQFERPDIGECYKKIMGNNA